MYPNRFLFSQILLFVYLFFSYLFWYLYMKIKLRTNMEQELDYGQVIETNSMGYLGFWVRIGVGIPRLINGRLPGVVWRNILSNRNGKRIEPTIVEVLNPVDVFAGITLCVEIFCVVFTVFIVSLISLRSRRCLTGVTIVDDVASGLTRFVVCVRNFIVELR